MANKKRGHAFHFKSPFIRGRLTAIIVPRFSRDLRADLFKNEGMKSTFVLILLGAVIGLSSGYLLFGARKTPPPAPLSQDTAQDPDETNSSESKLTPEVLRKLQDLSEKDIEDYLKLRDQRARYEKAEDILTRLLQIMITDLGLRIKHGQLEQLQDPASRLPLVESPIAQVPTPAPMQTPAPTPAQALPVKTAANAEWKRQGALLAEVRAESDVRDFLKKVEIADLYSELRQTTTLTQSQLDLLNGAYAGEMTFDDGKQRPWGVELRLNGRLRNNQITGNHLLTLAKDGKVFSRSAGRGNITDFTGFIGDPNALLVEAGGDNGYFQLYHFEKLGYLSGNYYQKVGAGNFRKVGTVVLSSR